MLGVSSPDGAKRNPGTINKLECRSGISLRFIQATKNKRKQNAARRMYSDGPHQRMRLAHRRQVYASLRTQNPRAALA
jgi:hypothetical protein